MPENRTDSVRLWRGCLFCKSGQENRTASLIEMWWPGVRACPVSAVKRRSVQGVKSLNMEVVMPGYVFFEAEEGFLPQSPMPDGVLRILTTVDGDWKLVGRDDEFARWLLSRSGEIEVSAAHYEGERIVVSGGPLKDLEGYITRIDRRNRNGLVELDIGSTHVRVWLPFELVGGEENGAQN